MAKQKVLNKRCLFKEIPLHPTQFTLDLFVGGDQDVVAKAFNKRYGADIDYYLETIHPNQVATIEATEDVPLNGEKRIVMNVEDFDMVIIVHELYHVTHHLSAASGVHVGKESQEWTACLMEYLYSECQNDGSFIEL